MKLWPAGCAAFVTLSLLPAVAGAIPASERTALLSIYNTTGGPTWTNRTGWGGAAGTECTWYGVTCDVYWYHVTGLALQRNNLTGVLPSALQSLPYLLTLNLGYNPYLTGGIPSWLGNLTSLQTLNLHADRGLASQIPGSLGNLVNLVNLDIANSNFSGALSWLPSLTRLQTLVSYDNLFNGPIPPEIGNLTSLTRLDLSTNLVSGPIPSSLGNLVRLTSLDLSGNTLLTGPLPSSLGNLVSVKELLLYGCDFTGPLPSSLGNLAQLTTLALNGNPIGGAIPSWIGNLAGLQDLALGWTQLTGAIPVSLASLSALRSLSLNGNQLVGEVPYQLTSLSALASIDLRWNALYSTSSALTTFLNARQTSGDWQGTQTVAPIAPGVTAATATSVSLAWTPIAYTGDTGGYRVFRSTTSGGPYTLALTTTSKSVSGATVTGLTPGLSYFFVVDTLTNPHTYNRNTVVSLPTAELPGTPGIRVLQPVGGSWVAGATIPASWTAGGATSFDLALWKGASFYRAIAAGVAGTSYSWSSPAWLPLGSDYRIRVSDHSGSGLRADSVPFSIVSATSTSGSLGGVVTSASTGAAVAGGSVRCDATSVVTAADGSYAFTSLPAGARSCTASAAGYASRTAVVTIVANGSVRKDFALPAASTGVPRIVDVSHGWRDKVYFLSGSSLHVDLTATADWAGLTPQALLFSTGGSQKSIATSGTQATYSFDAGSLAPCSGMKVQARTAGGTTSAAVDAPFWVMNHPAGIPPGLRGSDLGDGFFYEKTAGFDLNAFDEEIDKGLIPADIPIFGGKPVAWQMVPTVEAEITSAGEASLSVDFENIQKTKAKIAGFDFALQPHVAIVGQYAPCGWSWGGEIGAQAKFSGDHTWPYAVPIGPIPVPVFAAASFEIVGSATGQVTSLDPFAYNLSAALNPYVQGSLGVGVNRWVSVEGWIGGGAELTLQHPDTPHFKNFTVTLDGGIAADLVGWTYENKLLQWDWELYKTAGSALHAPASILPARPTLIRRDYLTMARQRPAAATAQAGTSVVALSSYPHPEPDIAAAGSYAYGTWIVDDAARAAVNRTKAVFASFDGTSWSTPVAVADDGTADYNPRVTTFGDGRAWVVWASANAVLADTAQPEDMLQTLEVKAALYDPARPGFGPSHRLTTNAYLDGSARLSGPSADNVLAAWIANPAGAFLGSASAPNTIYASRWNGAAWSAPETAAQVAYPILRSELVFDGTNAYVVLSLDKDGDTSTIEDEELALLRYSAGAWQPLQWLTDDAVVDANPRLVRTPGGSVLMAWLHGDTLELARDFDVTSAAPVLSGLYSTNFADFRLTQDADGRLAITWTQPASYSSDIWAVFNDPASGAWGDRQKLTDDPATEKELTSALFRGALVSLYARREQVLTAATRTSASGRTQSLQVPEPGPTDLYMLRTTLGEDVALAAGSFTVEPGNPAPGVPATFRVAVTNLGERAVTGAVVAFYDGDPTAGGVELGRASTSALLLAERRAALSFDWTVRATSAPLSLYAVVDPDHTTADRNRANNTLSLVLARPDLQVSGAGWSPQSGTKITVIARVTNNGATAAAASTLRFRRDGPTGLLLREAAVPALVVGQSTDVGLVVDVAGWPNGTLVLAVSDETNAIPEFDETNNTASLSVSLGEPGADVSLTIASPPTQATVGQPAVFDFTVANAGPDTARTVTLTHTLATSLTFVSAVASQGTCSELAGTVTCHLLSLAPAATASVVVRVRPESLGSATTSASVAAYERDANAANNQVQTTTTLLSPPMRFYTVNPCRVADTRRATGASGGPALAANAIRSFPVTGLCGVPSTAKAVAINVTVVGETDGGNLRLYPAGTTMPLASTINFATEKVRANNAVVPLGAGGQITVRCDMAPGSAGKTDFLFDVTGYFE